MVGGISREARDSKHETVMRYFHHRFCHHVTSISTAPEEVKGKEKREGGGVNKGKREKRTEWSGGRKLGDKRDEKKGRGCHNLGGKT